MMQYNEQDIKGQCIKEQCIKEQCIKEQCIKEQCIKEQCVEININFSSKINAETIQSDYDLESIGYLARQVLDYMAKQQEQGVILPYFADMTLSDWLMKEKELSIYITDPIEARALNLDARGKDYATNILSYPSELPESVLILMPQISLGELVICHNVLLQQANEQHKTIKHHLSHLLVHGILHLLGFDHELGDKDQEQMESFEIEILQSMGIANPYMIE